MPLLMGQNNLTLVPFQPNPHFDNVYLCETHQPKYYLVDEPLMSVSFDILFPH